MLFIPKILITTYENVLDQDILDFLFNLSDCEIYNVIIGNDFYLIRKHINFDKSVSCIIFRNQMYVYYYDINFRMDYDLKIVDSFLSDNSNEKFLNAFITIDTKKFYCFDDDSLFFKCLIKTSNIIDFNEILNNTNFTKYSISRKEYMDKIRDIKHENDSRQCLIFK